MRIFGPPRSSHFLDALKCGVPCKGPRWHEDEMVPDTFWDCRAAWDFMAREAATDEFRKAFPDRLKAMYSIRKDSHA